VVENLLKLYDGGGALSSFSGRAISEGLRRLSHSEYRFLPFYLQSNPGSTHIWPPNDSAARTWPDEAQVSLGVSMGQEGFVTSPTTIL